MIPGRGARALALLTLCLGAGRLEAASFRSQFRGPARALGDALADTVARSLPVISASPGISFTFDPSSGAMVRDTDLLGQLYLERARPLGRNRWNVSLSYQQVHVDSVQGEDLATLRDARRPLIVRGRVQQNPPVTGEFLVTYDRYDVDLTVNEVTLAATYGITDDLDVNLTLPILSSSLDIEAAGAAFRRNPNTGTLEPFPAGRRSALFGDPSESAAGVGDLFLRGKYRFLTHPWGELAAGLVLRMPTGDQDNFQGTGDWELSPLLYASTRRFAIADSVTVQGFVNGGVDLNIDDVDVSEGRFGAGIDVAFGQRATVSVAFLGREPFHGFTPAGFFDVPRFDLARGVRTQGPLFGLETVRPSYYTLSIGGRVNLWRDTLFGFANVLVPLNDEGIHTDPIPLVGFEATW